METFVGLQLQVQLFGQDIVHVYSIDRDGLRDILRQTTGVNSIRELENLEEERMAHVVDAKFLLVAILGCNVGSAHDAEFM